MHCQSVFSWHLHCTHTMAEDAESATRATVCNTRNSIRVCACASCCSSTTHRSTPQRTATHYTTPQHTTTHRNTPQHTATNCNTSSSTGVLKAALPGVLLQRHPNVCVRMCALPLVHSRHTRVTQYTHTNAHTRYSIYPHLDTQTLGPQDTHELLNTH